jgi:hypothetical protein
MSKPLTSLEDALAACLDDLDQGASPAQCLARFPEHAAELAPLLRIAARAQAQPLPVLSPTARVRGRERMHAALAQRAAGSGWLRAWVSGLAGAVVLLALAAGAWLSWPGRDRHLGGESTAQPAPPTLAATAPPSAIPTATLTTQGRSTAILSPSPTSESAPVTATATATPTPGPTRSATPTPSPAASSTLSQRAIQTNASPAADTAPAASPTIRPAGTDTRSPAETPQARETTEPAETPQARETTEPAETREPTEPAETRETTEPGETRAPAGAPATATPRPESTASEPPGATPQPTGRPEATPTPGQGLAATPTPDDDHHATPEPTEPPADEDRVQLDKPRGGSYSMS